MSLYYLGYFFLAGVLHARVRIGGRLAFCLSALLVYFPAFLVSALLLYFGFDPGGMDCGRGTGWHG